MRAVAAFLCCACASAADVASPTCKVNDSERVEFEPLENGATQDFDLEDGTTQDCECGTSEWPGATVLNPFLPWFKWDAYFDHPVPANHSHYIAVIPGGDEDTCKCTVVHYPGPNKTTPWQAVEKGVAVGYPTWCLGACGANCGEGYRYLREDHLHRRVGVLVHDVCQAYHNLTDRSIFTFTNRCRMVALHSTAAVISLFLRGQCGDGPPPPDDGALAPQAEATGLSGLATWLRSL
jgi:hypothetical protein